MNNKRKDIIEENRLDNIARTKDHNWDPDKPARKKPRDKSLVIGKELVCPFCNQTQSNESKYAHVSYWGEVDKDSDYEQECESCGKVFFVIEHVTRTFECVERME